MSPRRNHHEGSAAVNDARPLIARLELVVSCVHRKSEDEPERAGERCQGRS